MKRITNHALALCVSILFGLALVGPYILIASSSSFQGIYPSLVNDQNFYLARIQDARDGYPLGSNAYLAEWKDTAPVQILTGEYIEAKILDTLNVSTANGMILFTLLLAPLIFLGTYAISLRLGAPRFWALIITVFLCCGEFFFVFARPISPQFNLIFWLAAAYTLFSFKERPSWIWTASNSVAVGILFYLYPYYWTHLFAVWGLLFLYYLITDRRTVLKIFISGIGAIAIGSGALMLTFSAQTLPFYQESIERLGMIATHMPSGFIWLLIGGITLCIAAFVNRGKRIDQKVLLTSAFTLGGLIAMNQHVITGLNLEFSSHYAMQVLFATVFLGISIASYKGVWRHVENVRWKLATFGVIFIASFPFVTAPYIYALQIRENDSLSAYTPAITWLNENAHPEEVVYANEELSEIIPAYTTQNVFYTRNANFFLMPQTEVVDRFIIEHYGNSFTPEFINERERSLFGVKYIDTYNHALQQQKILSIIDRTAAVPERLPKDAVDAAIARAQELHTQPLSELLKNYRVDYAIVSPEDAVHLDDFSLVTSLGNFNIYRKNSLSQ